MGELESMWHAQLFCSDGPSQQAAYAFFELGHRMRAFGLRQQETGERLAATGASVVDP
jgi:hypothetical protein